MRALVPVPTDQVDVHAFYAEGWLEAGGIRANMIASVDGGAAVGGLSGGLQTPGDNEVFAALRDLADVVFVGSTTARTEKYRPVRPSGAILERRRSLGTGDALPVAVVSRSLRIDTSAPLFDGNRPLVITCSSSDTDARLALASHAEVLVCGDDEIDYAEVRSQLAGRGLRRVLCEGGPTVLAAALAAGAVDELCLTVAPLLVGPGVGLGAGRIVAGAQWADPRGLRLTGLLEQDGALFLRLAAVR